MEYLIRYHKELLLLLLKHGVDFILIGGYAVIFYGYSRATDDIDLWLKPSNKNKAKLIKALKIIGIKDSDIEKLDKTNFTMTNMFFIGKVPYKIDFLTKVSGVNWDEAIKNVNYLKLDNMQIPIIHYNDLITTKLLSSRLKDKADVEELQRINKHRK